jgi:hypothetical protein
MRSPRGFWWLLTVAACTPLGLWMYQDPAVKVARVRIDPDPDGRAPVIVALDLQNPNDYEVSATGVQLRLRLDELAIGQLAQSNSVPLPRASSSALEVPLTPTQAISSARLQAFGSGLHHYAVEGQATFSTPIGRRKVHFTEEGELSFGPPASSASAPHGPSGSP